MTYFIVKNVRKGARGRYRIKVKSGASFYETAPSSGQKVHKCYQNGFLPPFYNIVWRFLRRSVV
jgi:hypothetical protein